MRGLVVAVMLAAGAATFSGHVSPARADGGGSVVTGIVNAPAAFTCPTSTASNGKIVKAAGKPAHYSPTRLSGTTEPPPPTGTVASVCIKNTTTTTQTVTKCVSSPVAVKPGYTLGLFASKAGTYVCGLAKSTSTVTITIT